jgi:hypothetical protein
MTHQDIVYQMDAIMKGVVLPMERKVAGFFKKVFGKNHKQWTELPQGYIDVLAESGITEDIYSQTEMAGKSGVRAAYWYEDPAVYISAVFGGTVGYAGPPLLQGFLGVGASDCASDGNCDVLNVINKLPSRAQNHDIDKIANDILDWVRHGEKGKVIINEAKDVIVRNVEILEDFEWT